jgi:hypothetical protein
MYMYMIPHRQHWALSDLRVGFSVFGNADSQVFATQLGRQLLEAPHCEGGPQRGGGHQEALFPLAHLQDDKVASATRVPDHRVWLNWCTALSR